MIPDPSAASSASPAMARSLYLDLMERCLLNTIYEDPATAMNLTGDLRGFNPQLRRLGRDWPSVAHTMIGAQRLRNLRDLTEIVLQEGIPGDFIETGVWRGGACIMFRAVLKAYAETARRVFVADSFEGLPKPNAEAYPADAGDRHHQFPQLAISLENVQANFSKYGLLDDQVVFLKGWFKDTLPVAPISKLAILRLDGDMYESTMDALRNLYDKVSPGGFVIVDDYNAVPACKRAIHDFRAERNIFDPLIGIDQDGVYWRKSGAAQETRISPPVSAMLPLPATAQPRPFWSVIIPTYQRGDFLKSCLGKITAQDIPPDRMEILVADNDPESDLAASVREWSGGRALYTRNPRNLGVFPNFNAALTRSRGEWVHIMPDDDWIGPDFYATMEKAIATAPQAIGAAVGHHIHYREDSKAFEAAAPLAEGAGILGDAFRARLAAINTLKIPAVVIQRKTFEKIGLFREDLSYTGDWEFWFRIASRLAWLYVPDAVAYFRMHSGSQTRALLRTAQTAEDLRRTLDINQQRLSPEAARQIMPKARAHHARSLLGNAKAALDLKLSAAAARYIREACTIDADAINSQEFQECLKHPAMADVRRQIREAALRFWA